MVGRSTMKHSLVESAEEVPVAVAGVTEIVLLGVIEAAPVVVVDVDAAAGLAETVPAVVDDVVVASVASAGVTEAVPAVVVVVVAAAAAGLVEVVLDVVVVAVVVVVAAAAAPAAVTTEELRNQKNIPLSISFKSLT